MIQVKAKHVVKLFKRQEKLRYQGINSTIIKITIKIGSYPTGKEEYVTKR